MALDSNEYIRKLQEKYSLGNCEHFLHMRVLTQVVGGRVLYLELTLAQIQIWANYLVCYLIICFERDVTSWIYFRRWRGRVSPFKYHQIPFISMPRLA